MLDAEYTHFLDLVLQTDDPAAVRKFEFEVPLMARLKLSEIAALLDWIPMLEMIVLKRALDAYKWNDTCAINLLQDQINLPYLCIFLVSSSMLPVVYVEVHKESISIDFCILK